MKNGIMKHTMLKETVIETAGRLRMIQVDFAKESEETQSAYLKEQLETVIQQIHPEQKGEFIRLLRTYFPIAIDAHYSDGKRDAVSVAVGEQSSQKSPDDCVEAFAAYLSTATEEKKKELAERLFGSELIGPVKQREPDEQFNMPLNGKNITISLEHLIVSHRIVLDFISKIDHLVWATWLKLSPRSRIHPSGNLSEMVMKHLCGEPGATAENLTFEVDHLRKMTTAMVTAIARIGDQFANDFIRKYSPSAISSLVKMEKGGFFTDSDVKCWNKYKSLSDTSLTKDEIESKIKKVMVDYIESLPNLGRN